MIFFEDLPNSFNNQLIVKILNSNYHQHQLHQITIATSATTETNAAHESMLDILQIQSVNGISEKENETKSQQNLNLNSTAVASTTNSTSLNFVDGNKKREDISNSLGCRGQILANSPKQNSMTLY
ncbi:hypothetical protein ACTFIW_012783 [Dictyostelium discoideum]